MSWTLIEHQALTSSVASVTLGSGGTLPQTYKTLKLVISARSTSNYGSEVVDDLLIRLNGDTGNNYSRRILEGYGSSVASGSLTSNYFYASAITGNSATASTFGSAALDFPNYSGSTNKPISVDNVTENNATRAFQQIQAGLWSNSVAITSIACTMANGSFVANSTFTLYGLA